MDHRLSRRTLIGAGIAGLAGLAACGTPQLDHSTTVTATSAPTETPRPINLAITGDIMLARSVGTRMVASAPDSLFPFDQTATFLRGFDLTVGNLECVVSRLGAPFPGKPFTFRADPLGFARLQAAGFDLVSVANNHSGDYGRSAFADMLTHLPQYGMQFVGGGLNHQAAHAPVVIERNGTKIAFIAACDISPPEFAATATMPGHAWLDDVGLRQDVPAARALADFVIVFLHWGHEFVTYLDPAFQQQHHAHLAIDLGADLVVGCHPHDIQPNEIYRGKPIIYSLGNFVFDEMNGPESHGNILTLRVQRGELLDWKLTPITIDTATGAPYLA